MQLPKVLIYGQPFNKRNGGGITLSNLFMGWNKEKIAVAATGHVMYHVSTDICTKYYQLGGKEHKWKFPFNMIQKGYSSGEISISKSNGTQFQNLKKGFRYFLVNKCFYPLINWMGISHCASEINLSQNFKNWLMEYNPDILYLQVSFRHDIHFAMKLCDFLKVPSVIHMMDDWPSTICNKGFLHNYWKKIIDKDFRSLLNRLNGFISISDAMSDEYFKRYNKKFVAFHNPVDLELFSSRKKDFSIKNNTFQVLYIGRIGVANMDSIIFFAQTIHDMSYQDIIFKFYIFTPEADSIYTNSLRKLSNVFVEPSVPYYKIPDLLKSKDLLLLPLDFTKKGLLYSKFSMPTKISEYMISGTPILVFAPKETAVSKFIHDNDCGYCINEQNTLKLKDTLQFLFFNQSYRIHISQNATKIAYDRFNSINIRKAFKDYLTNIFKNQTRN